MKRNVITISRETGSGGHTVGMMLAEEENCVIVGRNSDAVLKDNDNCFHIFIHADMEHRVKRVLEHEIEEHNKSGKNRSNSGLNNDGSRIMYGDSEIMYSGNAKTAVDKAGESADEARIRHELELKDKTRGANYEYFTGRSWGSVGNYNLVIDTSVISEQDACEIILDILNRVNGGEKDA